MAEINDRIKERRLAAGKTLLEVAEYLGVKEATAQRYESGEIRKNSQARQAACRICGKDWQISALAVIPPSGYVCPVCETKQRKERLYGNENTQKRGIQNPAKYQHRTRYTPGK